ncbi:MAG: sodium/glutamate symporter [Lachnospiraceae bacterium]
MNATIMALSVAGLMTCVGMMIRTKSKALGKMLIPVNVIAGIIGLIYMNTINDYILPTVTVNEFSTIVDILFTFSFISIGLASIKDKKPKKELTKEEKKNMGGASITKGSMGMGILWSLLFGLTGVIGVLIIYVVGPLFGMDAMYGILIPYAFCQGPGQAANMGAIFEDLYGLQNAEMVGLTFAVVGFIAAFLIGVPLAKWGLRKKLQVTKAKITESVERGYYLPEEQREPMGKVTTHSGNIETLTLHVALMGVCYILAVIFAEIVTYVPGIGASFGSMLFMWGLLAAAIVKKVLRVLGVEFLLNKPLQNKITGWTSDFLVVCAFMAIKVSVVGAWIVPIVIESIVVALVTFLICVYFVSRLGSDHDYERVLGMYGMCTGTTPSGIALIRIVDPKLQTATATELGLTNAFMMFVMPVTIIVTFMGTGALTLNMACALIMVSVVFYLVLLKLCRTWNKPTVNIFKGVKYDVEEDDSTSSAGAVVQGMLRYEEFDGSGTVK